MAIHYKSNLNAVLRNMDQAKETTLHGVGTFVRGESQMRSPVLTGAYRDSHDYHVDAAKGEVRNGNSMDYGLWLEIGTSKMRGQHIIENSVMENVSRINSLIKRFYRSGLGG